MSQAEICVAQIGARRHYAIPAILSGQGTLTRFYTDLHAESLPVRALSSLSVFNRLGALRRARARQIRDVPSDRVYDFPWFGIRRMLRARGVRTSAQRYASYVSANRKFGRLVCHAGFADANTVYVFNGAGLEIMKAARKLGLKTIMEQTAADQAFDEQLLAEERHHWPHWEQQKVVEDDWRTLADREIEERSLADLVICGSEYVRDSIASVGETTAHCAVVPSGYRTVAQTSKQHSSGAGLNVLFAGSVCLRKGIQYLLKAADSLPSDRIAIRVVGPQAISDRAFRDVCTTFEYAGIVPRSEMPAQYAWADVLVLPTISEGSANVCYEALAAGLPVITTPHAGSVVRDGLEGFLVPIRSSEQLSEKILKLDQDTNLWQTMSENALARAQEFTWDRYAARLLAAVGRLFETQSQKPAEFAS